MPWAAAAATHPETPPLLPARESSFLLLSGRYGQQVAPVGNSDRGGKVPRALGLQSCPGAPGAECRPQGGWAGGEAAPPGVGPSRASPPAPVADPSARQPCLRPVAPVRARRELPFRPSGAHTLGPAAGEEGTERGVRPGALGSQDPQGRPRCCVREHSHRSRRDGGERSVRRARGARPATCRGRAAVCSQSERPGQGPPQARLDVRGGGWPKALEGNKEQSQSFDPRCDRSAVLHAPSGDCERGQGVKQDEG